MYKLLSLEKNDDYFNPISKRKEYGVYFTRFIGFDDEKMLFFRRYQISVQKKGIYIKNTINNPNDREVDYFFKVTGNIPFLLDKNVIDKNIEKWFSNISQKAHNLISEAIFYVLKELLNSGMNTNILKNAFVKFMCWGKYIFENVIYSLGNDELPKILYEGNITKYELYMLHILSCAGCDILYINFLNDNSYLKYDSQSKWSQVFYGIKKEIPTLHFSKIDLKEIEKSNEIKRNIDSVSGIIETNIWFEGDFFKEIFKTNSQRGILGTSHIYNMYVRYIGIDEKNIYSNRIFKLKNDIESAKRPLLIIEGNIGNPLIDETKSIHIGKYSNKDELTRQFLLNINSSIDKVLNTFIQRAFINAINNSDGSLSKVYNFGVKLLCWINRYYNKLFENYRIDNIPVFLYYGVCNQAEAEFLNMLSEMPVDVIYISPDKKNNEIFKNIKYDKGKEIILSESIEIFPFPKKEVKIRMATTAYNAQKELDKILYSDTGLFRNRQFIRSMPLTLKTTYDEISILWGQEAKYRPGFDTNNNRVIVPNIFAKVCGVENGDTAKYFQDIGNLLKEDKLIYISKFPYITNETTNTIKQYAYKFIKNKKILPDEIKHHKEYKYDFLDRNIQDYILEKIQDIIEQKLIDLNTPQIDNIIVSTLLNLDKETLRLIQQFDFTKNIPKLIVFSSEETMASLEDCIYILFLNLVGFDIVVFTPTGYRNIDKYINHDLFEEYQIGEYMYNLKAPHHKWAKKSDSKNQTESIFNKIFGRGRG